MSVSGARPSRSLPQAVALVPALTALAFLLAVTALTVSPRQAALMLVAVGLGVALYHGALGFTAHWRHWVANREGAGVRLQLWIVGLGSLAFFPLIGGWLPGFDAGGAVAPLGLPLLSGAFLFGIGMQLANGCGSGTLYTLGGGSTKMLLTLGAFIGGSLLATFHLHLWWALPQMGGVSLVRELGVPGALLAQALVIGALFALVRRLERPSRYLEAPRTTALVTGPWPPLVAASVLVGLAVVVFLLSGQPWSVTFAFALWGGKLYEALGFDLAQVPFWSAGWAQAALDETILRNATSVTDLGVIAGALLAAIAAGRFRPTLRIAPGHALAALVGGLAMGYGARLAYGCNIGAFLGGTMSGSLHGWLWLASALPGIWLGIKLRPLFGLAVEHPATD